MPHEGRSRTAESPGDAVDERQPLLGNGPQPSSEVCTSPDAASPEDSGANLEIVLPCVMMCAFLSAFDITVLATIYSGMSVRASFPVLINSGSDFNSSNRVSWIAVAYSVSNAAFQPLYGRLSDIFGRKPLLLFAYSVFLIGTVGCAISPGIWWLVASRLVAGMGGGGLNVLV
jgi:MFS family permease